jgi:hypothetical protein
MATGISIHVGVNNIDPNVFNTNILPPLNGCENDAEEMFKLARDRFHFNARTPFKSSAAKFDDVVLAMLEAAAQLKSGDTFLFTFSGHGSQRPDQEKKEDKEFRDEKDFKDEGIVLHDRILLDDFLRRNIWSQFKEGVRIIGVADSCHSGAALMAFALNPIDSIPSLGPVNAFNPGSSVRPPGLRSLLHTVTTAVWRASKARPVLREIPDEVRDDHFNRPGLREFYEELKKNLFTGEKAKVTAGLLTLAACRDNEETPDGVPNGRFTEALLAVMNAVPPPPNYDVLRDEVEKKLKGFNLQSTPTPVIKPDADQGKPTFRGEKPFVI